MKKITNPLFEKESIFYLALFTVFLVTWVMNWGYSLIQKDYIVMEGFELCPSDRVYMGSDKGLPETSHSVSLPINTTYTCQNFCGPPARCSKTGQQCTSDVDCLGCRPVIMGPLLNPDDVKGHDHAGKLLSSLMPDYSQLTTDMTRETYVYKEQKTAPPPSYFQGINTWKKPFTVGAQMYEKRYAPSIDDPSLAVNYPQRYTLSGEFMDDGPLAANA
jgi:hypothetical protein